MPSNMPNFGENEVEACIELESMTSPKYSWSIINSQLWRNRNLVTRATMKQRQAKQNNPSWSNAHILKEACFKLESMTSPNTVEVIINNELWRNRNLVTRATMKQRQAKQNNPSLPSSWSEHSKKKIDGLSHCISLWYHSWNTNWWNFKHR